MVSRRGFLQLVGLGAVGSLAPLPLFGATDKPLEIPGEMLSGHWVVDGGYADEAVAAFEEPEARIRFGGSPTFRGSGVHVEELPPGSVGCKFAEGRVELVCGYTGGHRQEHPLAEDEPPLVRFYAEAQLLRTRIRDQAIAALQKQTSRSPHGWSLVTVVGDPISGYVSGQTLVVEAAYQHWLARGDLYMSKADVHSSTGEYPVDDGLDIDQLIWIDNRVRNGKLVLPGCGTHSIAYSG